MAKRTYSVVLSDDHESRLREIAQDLVDLTGKQPGPQESYRSRAIQALIEAYNRLSVRQSLIEAKKADLDRRAAA